MTDGESSSGDEIDEWIGVDFDSEFDIKGLDWEQNVKARKRKIEKQLKQLIERFGNKETVVGHPEIEVSEISGRAIVQLECEFELRNDLRTKDYARVRELLRGVAKLLKDAGATHEELENIMIGTVWEGSLNILLDAPIRVLELLFAKIKTGAPTMENASLVDLFPAFSVNARSAAAVGKRLKAKYSELVLFERAGLLLFKIESMAIMIPTSMANCAALVPGAGINLMGDSEDKWNALPSVRCTETKRDTSASSNEVEEIPVQPLNYPSPSFGKATRVKTKILNPSTSEQTQVPNVVFETSLDNSPPKRAYWIGRKLRKTIYGCVRICTVLRLREGVTWEGENPMAEEGEAIWEVTPTLAAVKIFDWSRVKELQGRHMEDPLRDSAMMQYLSQGGGNPNVIGSLDVLADEQCAYVFMPYASRGELFDVVERDQDGRGRLSEETARFWFRQILNVSSLFPHS